MELPRVSNCGIQLYIYFCVVFNYFSATVYLMHRSYFFGSHPCAKEFALRKRKDKGFYAPHRAYVCLKTQLKTMLTK